MTLPAGTRLGPYEILAHLGAGGMGDVYRARDTRLAREVAVKVISASASSNSDRLRRFEQEAQSASALNHPNIVTIHDVGSESGVAYIAMELVEGTTLRHLLVNGPLPIKRVLQIGAQITEGLSKAHEAGIVHRDLKPENVMVNKDGRIKILDFGLAKLASTGSGSGEDSQLPTMTGTQPGVVVGTVGYMSPEQAGGQPVDFHSDQFSFGSMLYEMTTGKRAFQKKTAIDTLGAILNDDPEPIAQGPAPLRWIVGRCLAKDPRERYASTEDLARDLANVRDHISELSGEAPAAIPTIRSPMKRILGLLGVAALFAAGYFASSLRSDPAVVPRFEKVTFQKGGILGARFAPDGQTVVYAAYGVGGDSNANQLYSTRVGSVDSRSLGLPPADILSVSHSGQLAILLANYADSPGTFGIGTLAEASLSGGAPRQILEDVTSADWSPDGKSLAALHKAGEKIRLEYPAGKVLYESASALGGLRVSPDGRTVAFWERRADDFVLRLVDRDASVRTLMEGAYRGCWSADGDELWWIRNIGDVASEIHALTTSGRDRVITSLAGDFRLHDLAKDGRLLVEQVYESWEVSGAFPGEAEERSLAWLDSSFPTALSADGRMLLFGDRRDTAGGTLVQSLYSASWATYLRKTDGSPAVRLGDGDPLALSPDGNWALVRRTTPDPHFVLLPTGAGQERSLSPGPVIVGEWARFHPDGRRVFMRGSETGHGVRTYEQRLDSGSPKPVTPEGFTPTALSPDGAQLAGIDAAQNLVILPTDAEIDVAPRIVMHLSANEYPIHWSGDGRSLLVVDFSARPNRVDRLELSSGVRTRWREFSPGGLSGLGGLSNLLLAAGEQSWVAGYRRYFSELLVVDGLK